MAIATATMLPIAIQNDRNGRTVALFHVSSARISALSGIAVSRGARLGCAPATDDFVVVVARNSSNARSRSICCMASCRTSVASGFKRPAAIPCRTLAVKIS